MQKTQSGTILNPPSANVSIIYGICFIANILVNFDHGIVPAASKEIKSDQNLSDFELGLLGSVVYVGLLLGSVAAANAFMKVNSKKLIFCVIMAYITSLLLFLLTNRIILLGLSRTLVGFFQVFLVVFFPVWVDLHGGTKQTLWLTFLQLGVPLGVFLGYITTSVYVKFFGNWQYSFLTQIFLLLPCGLSLLAFSSTDLDVQMKEEDSHQVQSKLVQKQNSHHVDQTKFQGRISNHHLSIEPALQLQRRHTYMSNLSQLFSNKIFLLTMLTLASLYFVVTGIQFWISDYMRTVLDVDQDTVFKGFSFISITAPTIGVLYGGIALDKVGGYAGKNVLNLCLINGIMASVCAIPIPFLNNFKIVIVLLWFLFFFGGALMPAVTGLMLHSVPKNYRAFGNSQAQLFHNLLGYLPSPFIYGFVNQISNNPESRNGMKLLMFWSLWGVVGLFLAKKQQQILNQIKEDQVKEELAILQRLKEKKKQMYNDAHSEKIPMSKITEKESEQSQSFIDNIDSVSPFDKTKQFEWSYNKDDVIIENQNRPYAYNALNQPLITKGQKSAFFGGSGVTFANDSDKNKLSKSQGKVGGNQLNFSQIKPQFYKYNQTPRARNSGITRKSSLAFLTMGSMLGKNSILFIDDPDDDDDNNNYAYQEPDYLQDEELQIYKDKYNIEYDLYERNNRK